MFFKSNTLYTYAEVRAEQLTTTTCDLIRQTSSRPVYSIILFWTGLIRGVLTDRNALLRKKKNFEDLLSKNYLGYGLRQI